MKGHESKTLADLQSQIQAWQLVTFPGQTAESKAEHLIREAKELRNAPGDVVEMADCLILLIGIAAMKQVSTADLLHAAWNKFEACKRRTWNVPDADGVYSHKKEVS